MVRHDFNTEQIVFIIGMFEKEARFVVRGSVFPKHIGWEIKQASSGTCVFCRPDQTKFCVRWRMAGIPRSFYNYFF